MNHLYRKQLEMQAMIDQNRSEILPGLIDMAREMGFEDFEIVDYRSDQYNSNLALIQFVKDKKYGLCIWNHVKKQFIEEPSTLDDYGVTLEKICAKYKFKIK